MKKRFLSILVCLTLSIATFLQYPLMQAKAASSALTSNQVYYIKNKRTGKYLTASSSSSGATLSLQNFSKGTLQKFKITLAETTSGVKYYTITLNANTNLKVNVTNSSNADGVRIGLTTTTSASAQRFKFILNSSYGQNSYKIMPKLSTTRVFSIADNLGSGVPVYLYGNYSAAYHQDWIIENINQDIEACPNVKINNQEQNDTCGCACVRNILSAFNLNYSEKTIRDKATAIAGKTGSDYTYVWVLTNTLNYFLSSNSKNVTYSYNEMNSITDANWYAFLLSAEASKGYPIIFNGNFSTNSYVPYLSTGHYVLGTGLKSSNNSTSSTAIISDVYRVQYTSGTSFHAGIWEMPVESLMETNQKHSSGGYIIAAEITL